ncbi:cupin domain-containing protein [Histidinibacterium aquaticum]|uniref:Cupin domain-containing protein n=1 Tax=Histidinibacterium aquaticum TaxID=2613962 RepID=A0A5J5GAX2_9RHOB|nr:cupin domain-containing protein [Histidinibacterium aquaticum]KAA9005080.1 cupin domain-containing protein [Histidinibacterium aquaticum]
MPVFKRAGEGEATRPDTPRVIDLLTRESTKSDHVEAARIAVPKGTGYQADVAADEVVWFQVLRGSGSVNGQPLDRSRVAFTSAAGSLDLTAEEDLDLLWVRVPAASRFDPKLASDGRELTVIDWSREPILQSEHDSRNRIYMATPALVGTDAIKAEMVTYPPGTAAPEHHHVGAEHFQFVLSGKGTAVLNGEPLELAAGDVLYHYEHELHYFFTDPGSGEDFVFVEFFVPGHCETVWVDAASACAWLPTGKDSTGNAPTREIAYHVHGDDGGI